jgi:hypothetical protein
MNPSQIQSSGVNKLISTFALGLALFSHHNTVVGCAVKQSVLRGYEVFSFVQQSEK